MTNAQGFPAAFIRFNHNGLTLVASLAYNGQDEHIMRLLQLGAKTTDAVYGYALAGRHEQIEQLISHHPEDSAVLLAHAYLGSIQSKNNFGITKFSGNHPEQKIIGLARAGDTRSVQSLLQKDPELYPAAIKGFACTNQVEPLKQILLNDNFYNIALYHAAVSGHHILVDDLLKKSSVTTDHKDFVNMSRLNNASQGYVHGCHYKEAAQLIEQGASITLSLIDTARDNPDVFSIVYCYVKKNEYANKVLQVFNTHLQATGHHLDATQLESVQGIRALMLEHELNYLDAKKYMQSPTNNLTFNSNEISLDYLSNMIQDTDNMSHNTTKASLH